MLCWMTSDRILSASKIGTHCPVLGSIFAGGAVSELAAEAYITPSSGIEPEDKIVAKSATAIQPASFRLRLHKRLMETVASVLSSAIPARASGSDAPRSCNATSPTASTKLLPLAPAAAARSMLRSEPTRAAPDCGVRNSSSLLSLSRSNRNSVCVGKPMVKERLLRRKALALRGKGKAEGAPLLLNPRSRSEFARRKGVRRSAKGRKCGDGDVAERDGKPVAGMPCKPASTLGTSLKQCRRSRADLPGPTSVCSFTRSAYKPGLFNNSSCVP
mmetsp:Transcript_118037/g.376350  ORF Transcript_118037/g.376350 Transcript_118037/m.376350 type:complete len:273 (-) Transcript_118037:264-1082(-)